MTEPTELTDPVEVSQKKVKKTRSPEQLEVLAKAREKALQIRRENAELRKAEKDIDKEEKATKLKERRNKVENYNKQKSSQLEEVPEVARKEPSKIKSKKPKKKVLIIEESESESEEEEVIVVKKPKAKKKEDDKPEQITNEQKEKIYKRHLRRDNYNNLYNSLFRMN